MGAFNSLFCDLLLTIISVLGAYAVHMHKAHSQRVERLHERLIDRISNHEQRLARVEDRMDHVESDIYRQARPRPLHGGEHDGQAGD